MLANKCSLFYKKNWRKRGGGVGGGVMAAVQPQEKNFAIFTLI